MISSRILCPTPLTAKAKTHNPVQASNRYGEPQILIQRLQRAERAIVSSLFQGEGCGEVQVAVSLEAKTCPRFLEQNERSEQHFGLVLN
jgi:hypothetical protein